jgi:O-acetyl-ADP-ribose deacetylase (regulator of RNase III)
MLLSDLASPSHGAYVQWIMCRGFNLPAKWVIHTVGPVYDDGTEGRRRQSEDDLQLAYA